MTLTGCRALDPASGLDARMDICIEQGRVKWIAAGRRPEGERITLTGLIAAPGCVDMHVHLREPGLEHKETIATGTRAAVMGGFTTICCMANTRPPIDRPERVAELRERIGRDAVCNVLPIGAATIGHGAEALTDFRALLRAGCVAVTDDAFPMQSIELKEAAAKAAALASALLIVHCEDTQYSRDGVMNLGHVSRALGLPGQDAASERSAILQWRAASEAAGVLPGLRLHIAHVSSEAGLRELVRWRATSGAQNVTMETAPHYFTLTEEAVREHGAVAKINPPLRGPADMAAIRAAVAAGVIPVIATDHAPHSDEEKRRDMREAPFGFVGLETCLSLVLTHLVESGGMPLLRALAAMTANPARILRIEAGTLAPGKPADIVIIDPRAEWTVDPTRFASKARTGPFAGCRLRGRVWGTVVGGRFVVREGQLLV